MFRWYRQSLQLCETMKHNNKEFCTISKIYDVENIGGVYQQYTVCI